MGVHILDKVVEVYEEVAFIPKELAISRAGGRVQEKGTGPEARNSLSCSGAFEITMAGQ